MFDEVLIESAGREVRRNTFVTAGISGVIHVLLLGAVVAAGMYVKQNPKVIEKPMDAFVVAAAPPPPPPASGIPTHPRAQITVQREPRHDAFTQPRDVPRDVPVVDEPFPRDDADDEGGALDGGVAGGVPGGVKGGQKGGVIGGDLNGELGGVLGGKPGAPAGGTGIAIERPLVVGGNVKAPVAVKRVDPVYPEVARKARTQGIVIIEAIIDRQGNVTEARVLKPLPFGLDVAALNAVRQWKFQPGTLNGEPVPVYYNLTVNFRIE